MTTAEELQRNAKTLLAAIFYGVSGFALDQLEANLSHALTDSFANGDRIRVAGSDQCLTTRLQVLSALNRGYMIDVESASTPGGLNV